MKIKFRAFLFFAIIVLGILSVIKAASLVKEYGCVDLLCRTMGTRFFHNNKSAYYFKWTEGESIFFLNPNDNPDRKVNGNVVTPAVFQLSYFLSKADYPVVKVAWAILQYIFLFSSVFLMAKVNKKKGDKSLLAVVITLAMYLYSNIWFYNIERGQIYSFYLFILSVIYFFYNSTAKRGKFIAGFINGFGIFFRPLLIFFGVVFLLKKDVQAVKGWICGFLAGVLLLVLTSAGQWKDYFSAMKEYGAEIIENRHNFQSMKDVPPDMDGLTSMRRSRNFDCGGLSTIQYYFSAKGILLHSGQLATICLLAIAICCFLFVKAAPAGKTRTNEVYFLFAFFIYMLSELFIVGYRSGYNQIEWVFAVFIILSEFKKPVLMFVTLFTGIMLENIKVPGFKYQFELAEICLFAVLLYLLAGSLALKKRKLHLPDGAGK